MKKLTTGETNLLKEFGLDKFTQDEPRTITHTNRFSGVPVEVNRLESGLYREAMEIYNQYEMGRKVSIGKADRLKYLLLKLNNAAYMTLLD